jgi:hypothetical protein
MTRKKRHQQPKSQQLSSQLLKLLQKSQPQRRLL